MKKILLFSVILLLFLAGCKQQPTTPTGASPFIGGTKALDIKFMENAPPAEIFDLVDSSYFPFEITLKIENVGEADIVGDAIKVRLSGLYEGDFKENTNTGYFPLPKEGLTVTQSSKDTLIGVRKDSEGNKIPGGIWLTGDFPEIAYAKTLSGSITLPLRADISYTYTNTALVMYCLRRSLMSRMSGICEVAGAKTVYNSAGPVHVTSVTESIAGSKKLLFTIRVKNVGSGRLLKYGVINYFSEELEDQNKVWVVVDPKIEAQDILRCSNLDKTTKKDTEGFLRLDEAGEGIFTCTLDTAGLEVEAVKEMEITTTYKYLESLPKSLTVKHLIS